MILFRLTVAGNEAVNIKVYKDGTTCRHSIGALPEIGISGMSCFDNSPFFAGLQEKIPQQVLDKPIMYEEPAPNGLLEYVVGFYGASTNGMTGERADWSLSTGVRLALDLNSEFNHPIRGFMDYFISEALEVTNAWYFDVLLKSRYNMLCTTLPKQTMIAQPKAEADITVHFENYINQLLDSGRKWSAVDFVKDKTYESEGMFYSALVNQDEDSFSINFVAKQ